VHTFGQTPEAIVKYLEFVGEASENPFLIDSTSAEARIAGANYATEVGLADRAIYNSLITTNKEEQNAFKEIGGVKYAVCLSYEESAEESIKKTRQLLRYFGSTIEKPIIDPGVPTLGRGSSSALERAWILKNQLGFPTAIGIHNLHSSQQEHKDIEFGFDYTLPTIFGVDINLYGPIKNASKVFPSVAAAQIAVADETFKILGVLPRQPHPYYRIFGEEGALHQQHT
jgi:tetrahydromethanopterin S-methyltransferase subunit H